MSHLVSHIVVRPEVFGDTVIERTVDAEKWLENRRLNFYFAIALASLGCHLTGRVM